MWQICRVGSMIDQVHHFVRFIGDKVTMRQTAVN